MGELGRDPILGYPWAGVTPEQAGAPDPGAGRPMGDLLDPEAAGAAPLPFVPADPSDEPLVAGPGAVGGVEYLPVYAKADWRHATAGCWLRQSVWTRLHRAAGALPAGFGLCIWDGWRDPALQSLLYDDAYAEPGLEPGFVNPASEDPRTPAPHSTGGTVDLTLSWQGAPLLLGTGFDAFVPRARAAALESADAGVPGTATGTAPGDELARNLRRLLRWTLAESGFVVLASEWWHFETGTRLWAAVHGVEPVYSATAPAGPAVEW